MFPDFSIQWQTAGPLVDTIGTCFTYQPPDGIHEILSKEIYDHFGWYNKQSTDKNNHPLFLVLSGAGTGKSRLLDEFQSLCVSALANSSPELSGKIKDAYVFKVNFENGVSSDTFTEGGHSIGSRMLYQLTSESWPTFSQNPKARVLPDAVLTQLARIENKKLSDMTILLLVDGMQELPHEASSKQTKFYTALKAISDLVNGNSKSKEYPFVIACCSAIFHNPVSSMLAGSNQRRVDVVLSPLNGRTIFSEYIEDPLISLLVDDMGGHGRALEALWITLSRYEFNIQNCSMDDLMISLRGELSSRYPTWVDPTFLLPLIPLLKAVLTRQRFQNLSVVLPGCNGTVDDHVKLGLFRWNVHNQTIECPYILLWLLAAHCGDTDLQNLMLGDYKSEQHNINPQKCGKGMQCWMHWEDFVARFRCLKSHVLEGNTTKWSDLHAGAQFGPGAEQLVKVKRLSLVCASHQYATNTNDANMLIQHEMGSGRLADDDLLVVNGPSAPASDAFLALELNNNNFVKESIQCKNIRKPTTTSMIKEEIEKSKSTADFFTYMTTGPEQDGGVKLDARCAFVNDSRFKDYFGPYAGRAFFMCRKEPPNINSAPRSHLVSVNGISDEKAEIILEKRKDRDFQDLEDCMARTSIPRRVLERFKF
jgi:hypothetical protein